MYFKYTKVRDIFMHEIFQYYPIVEVERTSYGSTTQISIFLCLQKAQIESPNGKNIRKTRMARG